MAQRLIKLVSRHRGKTSACAPAKPEYATLDVMVAVLVKTEVSIIMMRTKQSAMTTMVMVDVMTTVKMVPMTWLLSLGHLHRVVTQTKELCTRL